MLKVRRIAYKTGGVTLLWEPKATCVWDPLLEPHVFKVFMTKKKTIHVYHRLHNSLMYVYGVLNSYSKQPWLWHPLHGCNKNPLLLNLLIYHCHEYPLDQNNMIDPIFRCQIGLETTTWTIRWCCCTILASPMVVSQNFICVQYYIAYN